MFSSRATGQATEQSGSQNAGPVYNSATAAVALPVLADLPDFTRHSVSLVPGLKPENDVQAMAFFNVFARTRDGLNISVELAIGKDAKLGSQLLNCLGFHVGGKLPAGTLSGRRIGQGAWARPDGQVLYAYDGRAGVRVLLSPRVSYDETRRPKIGAISKEDVLLAENLAIQTLDRLTAMGVTSRPKESAPGTARNQVTERLAALKK